MDCLRPVAEAGVEDRRPDDYDLAKPQSATSAADSKLRVAEANMEVVCQAKVEKKDQIVRVVKDANKCFKEIVSPFKGTVEKREEVPCNTQCTPAG
jgi:hypothetical protein